MKTTFIGYYHATEDEFADLWQKCFFSFDANTLLNLYRYSPETSQELLRILSHAKIKDRIWIPHQVGYEFFQGRLTVIAEQRKAYEDVKKELNKPLASFQSRHRHPFVDDTRLQNLSTLISDLVTELDRRKKLLTLKQNDPIVQTLFAMFEKKAGPPYSDEKLQDVFKQGADRYARKIPPGYMDEQNKEEPRRKYGDLIIWLQLLEEARKRKTPAIFITADEKPDWWTIIDSEGKHVIGPRPELIQEMFEETGMPFYMYSPPEFMKYVAKLLQEEVSQKALEEARAVDEARVQRMWSGIGAVGSAIYSGSVPVAVFDNLAPGTVLSGTLATQFPDIPTVWILQKLRLEVGKFAHEWESARIREPSDIAGAQHLLTQYGTLLMGLSVEALRCGIPISQELLAVGKRMTQFGSAVVADDPAVGTTFWQLGQEIIIELKTLLFLVERR